MRDFLDLTAELEGVSSSLFVLSQNFEDDVERTVSDKTIKNMLFAAYTQISRIIEDLDKLEHSYVSKS